MAAEKTYGLEKTLQDLDERARQSGTTDSELSELEVSVASAMAQVQQAESEVRGRNPLLTFFMHFFFNLIFVLFRCQILNPG